MHISPLAPLPILPYDLGDGLLLRQSTFHDLDRLSDFNQRIHFFVKEHDSTIPAMTHDLLSGNHPGCNSSDFFLVEDQTSGKIIAATALISQTWSYGSVTFQVGRPELVGTDPDYRGRGLIRALFHVIHAASQARGQIVQAITGIPFFYRQFGYEMGLPSGGGWIGAALQRVPLEETSVDDRLLVRPAWPEDLSWIQPAYEHGRARFLVSSVRDKESWQYELTEKDDRNIHKFEFRAITTQIGQPAGFFFYPKLRGPIDEIVATWFELMPGFSWHQEVAVVLRALWQEGQDAARKQGGNCSQVGLMLGEDHPSYPVARLWLDQRSEPGIWYVRVADLPAFLCRIAPVLEARLAASAWSGFHGTLRISQYRNAFAMEFKDGALVSVQPYSLANWEDADAAFPFLTFLQLVFGHRSLSALRAAFPDCWVKPQAAGLLETLFPQMPSQIWGLA